jgi:hypothetical protein
LIETLYFLCYYAYLKADLEKATMYYALLRDEFREKGRRDSLREDQYRELAKVKRALDTGLIPTTMWLEEPNTTLDTGDTSKPDHVMKQDKLVRLIHTQGLNYIKNILEDDVYLNNIEQPCAPYGAVDMVYMGKKTVYPLEVKKDQGRHDLIGQIYKYDLYHKLRLHYKFYERVQSVTICRSYDALTLEELKKMGVIPLIYSIGNSIFISKA